MADQDNQEDYQAKLAQLELEHRDLDDVIKNLEQQSDFDQLKLTRLKKRKLALRDQIRKIHGKLLPDIIA